MRKHRQSRLQFSSLCPWGWVQAGWSVQAGYPLRTSASPSQKESRWEREGPVWKASSLLSFGEWWTLSTRCPFFRCSSQCIWAVLPGPALSSGVPHGASELRYLVPSHQVFYTVHLSRVTGPAISMPCMPMLTFLPGFVFFSCWFKLNKTLFLVSWYLLPLLSQAANNFITQRSKPITPILKIAQTASLVSELFFFCGGRTGVY